MIYARQETDQLWSNQQLTGVLLILCEELLNLVTDFTIGHADIILGVTVVVHEGEETVVGDVKLLDRVSTIEGRTEARR